MAVSLFPVTVLPQMGRILTEVAASQVREQLQVWQQVVGRVSYSHHNLATHGMRLSG